MWHVSIQLTGKKKKSPIFVRGFPALDDHTCFVCVQQCVSVFWHCGSGLMGFSVKCILVSCRSDKNDNLVEVNGSFRLGIFFFYLNTMIYEVLKCFESSFNVSVCVCVCVSKAVSIRRHGSEWGWCLPKPWRASWVSMQQAHIPHIRLHISSSWMLNRPFNPN